ncbi:MAG: glycosyltransferase family 1 protein [Planctomycetes bacterium]|nr:glycosyltransferase family 1 protein [Planctomycetota bacterium]MCB9872121.1 glycosyltransferase family 1 protein [Planctomycetota bacterium]
MSLRIVVTGLIGQYPMGGVTWDYFQYVLGLHRLGHEVYYLEDTGIWPYAPAEDGTVKDCAYNVDYLARLFERFGLGDRWAYCFAWQKQWFGMADATRREVVESADLLINVSGMLERPQEYRGRGRLVYIDSDPTFTQVKLAKGYDYFRALIDAHDVTFSFGELLDQGASGTPPTGHRWLPTRQPMVLAEWPVGDADRGVFTTVMNWNAYKPIEYQGTSFGQKDVEFAKFHDLPQRVAPVRIELAANAGKGHKLPRELLQHRGFTLVDPSRVCPDLDAYRDYVTSSRAEWSVAKSGYVAGRSGWFSCRSSCYLAAGRPVVVQDTGFGEVLPVGRGLLAFRDLEGAIDAIRTVEADYAGHRAAARDIAEQYFDSDKVLGSLVERAMSSDAVRPGSTG